MRAAILVLAVLSCAPRPSPSKGAADPSAQPPPTPVTAPPAAAGARTAPVEDPACEEVTFAEAGASVLVIPGATMTRALMPVVRAACACTRPGERLRLTAVIRPEAGVVHATAHDDEAADRCIQATLEGRFAPFELGSDCVGCGPRRLPLPHGPPPPAPPRPEPSTITYPFTLVHP